RVLFRSDSLIVLALCVVGRSKLIIAFGIVLKLLQQRLAGLNRIVIAFQAIIRIGQTSISRSQIVGIKLAGLLNQALVDLAGILVAFAIQIALGQTKAGSIARGIKLDRAGICLNRSIRIILERAPGTQMFPGFRVRWYKLNNALVGKSC